MTFCQPTTNCYYLVISRILGRSWETPELHPRFSAPPFTKEQRFGYLATPMNH